MCVRTAVRAGLRGCGAVSPHGRPGQRAGARRDPCPARDLCQLRPNPEVSTLARWCPRSSSLVACIKTLGFRPGCSFPSTQHPLTAGNSFGPKKKVSNCYVLQERVLFPPPFSSQPCNRAKTNREISAWVPASPARNGNVDGCARVWPCSVLQHPGPRTPLPVLTAATRPTGNKKTADSINTSVRCSKKKRQLPLLEWEAT